MITVKTVITRVGISKIVIILAFSFLRFGALVSALGPRPKKCVSLHAHKKLKNLIRIKSLDPSYKYRFIYLINTTEVKNIYLTSYNLRIPPDVVITYPS